jgi:hypothetical protein
MVAAKLRKRSVLSDFALRINSLSARISTTSGTARKCVIRAHTQHCAYERLQHFHLSMAAYQVDYTVPALDEQITVFDSILFLLCVHTVHTRCTLCTLCTLSGRGLRRGCFLLPTAPVLPAFSTVVYSPGRPVSRQRPKFPRFSNVGAVGGSLRLRSGAMLAMHVAECS